MDLPRKMAFPMGASFVTNTKMSLRTIPIFTNLLRLQREVSDGITYSVEFSIDPAAESRILELELSVMRVEFTLFYEAYGNGFDYIMCNTLQDALNPAPTLYLREAQTADRPTISIPDIVHLSFTSGNRLQLFGCYASVLRETIRSILDVYYSVTDQMFEGDLARTGISFTQWQLDSKWGDQSLRGTLSKNVLLLNILGQMKVAGYRLHASFVTNRESSKLFFIQVGDHEEQERLRQSKLSLMTLNGNSSVQIFGYDSRMIWEVKKAIQDCWVLGLKSHGGLTGSGDEENTKVWEFELNGLPWWRKGLYLERNPLLLMEIFKRLAKCGWVVESAFNFGVGELRKPMFLFSHRVTDCIQFLGLVPSVKRIAMIGASSKVIAAANEIKHIVFRTGVSQDEELVDSTEMRVTIPLSLHNDDDNKARKFQSLFLSKICSKDDRVIGSVCLTNLSDDTRKNEFVAGSSVMKGKAFGDETIFVALSRSSAARWADEEP